MCGAIPLLPLRAFMTFTGKKPLYLPSLISTPKTRENAHSTRTRLRPNSQQLDARNAGINWLLCLCVRILLFSFYCYLDLKNGGRNKKEDSTTLDIIWYNIFVNCNWVDTRWQHCRVHIYTQTVHRTQLTTLVWRLSGIRTQSFKIKLTMK
jgi:hypothetical protein